MWPGRSLSTTNTKPCPCLKEGIPILGCGSVYLQEPKCLYLWCRGVHGPTLLARDWLSKIRLDWTAISCSALDEILGSVIFKVRPTLRWIIMLPHIPAKPGQCMPYTMDEMVEAIQWSLDYKTPACIQRPPAVLDHFLIHWCVWHSFVYPSVKRPPPI